jgi:hypothetical protein
MGSIGGITDKLERLNTGQGLSLLATSAHGAGITGKTYKGGRQSVINLAGCRNKYMKKISISIIVTGVAILVFLVLYTFKNREDISEKETLAGEVSKQTPKEVKNTIVHPELGVIQAPLGRLEPESGYKDELTDDMKKSILEDVESHKLWHRANMSAGFSDYGATAMASGDPFSLLSINDLPLVLQKEIRGELEKREKLGHDLISDKVGDEILRIKEYVDKDPSTISQNINFALSELPESLTDDNYEYIGHTFPGTPLSQSEDETYSTIRRVYESTSNPEHLIVVEEASLTNGSSTLVREFVNTDVNEYPAIYSEKKTESGETYAMLTWTTQTSAYSIYQVGSVDDQTAGKIGSMAGESADVNVGK